MDFRFQYRRRQPDEAEVKREVREDKDALRRMRGLAIGMSIPMTLAAGPLAGWLLGSWLDRHFQTQFWMLTLILLGTFAGLKTTIDMLIRLGRQ